MKCPHCEKEIEVNLSAPVVEEQKGSSRVLRGGSWYNDAQRARSALRSNVTPGYRRSGVGFRIVRTIKTQCDCGTTKHGFASHAYWCTIIRAK